MKQYHVLTNHTLEGPYSLITPETAADISLDSPAVTLFTDFCAQRPLVIESGISVIEAESFMKRAHVKLKLVVDGNNQFLGTLSFADLQGERAQRLMGLGTPRPEISVKEVMTPADTLRAINYADLSNATVGDIMETLKQEQCQHFLVVEPEDHKIRGIFSASDLARRLHIPIDIARAPTFFDVCHVVYQRTQHDAR